MEYDVIIIGGGPAGMYTALTLSEKNIENILVLELGEDLGGNLNYIIEADETFEREGYTGVEMADDLRRSLILHGIDYETKSYVLSVDKEDEKKRLQVLSPDKGLYHVKARSLVVATGARERPRGILNFVTGRTTGIFSVGTARKFIVEEGYLPGNRILIYGADWTGLYLAKLLKTEGADEVTIVDQVKELNYPSEMLEEFHRIHDIKALPGWVLTDIQGEDRITGVTLEKTSGKSTDSDRTIEMPCDTILLAVGLTPQRQLYRKFRRNPEEKGVFITGNADRITLDLRDIQKRARQTAEQVEAYLKVQNERNES